MYQSFKFYFIASVFLLLGFNLKAEVFIPEEITTDTAQLVTQVHALRDFVIAQDRIVSRITDNDLANLPLALEKEINGRMQYLLFDNLVITPEATFVNVYVSLDFPLVNKRIAFAALKLRIHKGGIAASTGTRLTLLNNVDMPIGDQITINLLAETGQNSIEWDCNGFKSISLNGNVEISQKIAKEAGNSNQMVRADFNVQASDPGSIVTQINLPPFELKQLPGFRFTASKVTLDFSDDSNALGFVLPESHRAEYGTYPQFWTGVHMGMLKIDLPEELNVNGKRISLEAQNMFIDRQGFTGAFTAEGLVSLEEGSLASWPFSINKFYVIMTRNKLSGSSFSGDLKLPLFDQPMEYAADIYWNGTDLDYQVLIETSGTVHSDLLLADIVLDKNSIITVEKLNGRFEANAVLHGVANLDGGNKITAKGLHFKNLTLSSTAPVIRGGQWGMKTEAATAGFPLQIDSIGIHHNLNDLALIISAKLTLMEGSEGFSGATTLGIESEFKEITVSNGDHIATRHEFNFKQVRIHDIDINVKTDAFSLIGHVRFFDNDPTYGNGFQGALDAEIAGFNVTAKGTFGKLPDYRYWYVEAMADVKIPLGPSNFAIYRLAGGLYYHMKQSPLSPDGNSGQVTYVPDKSVALGFKAGVTLGMIPDPYVFNGDAFFEIAFSSHGGVKYIQFVGDAFFMTPMEDRGDSDVKLYASLMMRFDFENKIFHATLETYINVLNILKGTGPNDLAGWAELYFSPDEWFIHIGRPDKRVGLAFVALGNQPLVRADSYFMAGHRIPDMPELPPEVSRLTGKMSLSRDEGLLGQAKGMAFGTSLQLNTGKIKFLVFYGEIGAGLGFDVMLRDLSSYSCANTGEQPGINGWYASGQAWAYIMAEIGIHVDLAFVKGEFPILQLAMAAALQAELPNPVFMQGAVAGEFNILGGLVSGKCNFKFSFGEKCEISGTNAITGVKAIGEIKPNSGEKDTDVFTKPQVALNVSEGAPMEILNNNNEFKFYRVTLEEFSVKHKGQLLEGKVIWNDSRNTAIYKTESILPPTAKIDVIVKIAWQEKISGQWKNMSQGGKDLIEEEQLSFTTGEAPKTIPEENVRAAYPFTAQHNFYPKEVTNGYILLDTDQEYLFKDPNTNYNMHFVSSSQATVQARTSYDRAQKKLMFELPTLANETAYKLVLVKSPKNTSIGLKENLSSSSTAQLDQDGSQVNVQHTTLKANLTVEEDFTLYQTYFRTSRYNKFVEKVDEMDAFAFIYLLESRKYKRFGLRANMPETFGKTEVEGNAKFGAIVTLQAMEDINWFQSFAGPVIYKGYPLHPQATIEWRAVGEIGTREGGTPPDKPMIIQQRDFSQIKQSEVEMGVYSSKGGQVDFMHDWDFYAYNDYRDIKNELINIYNNNREISPGVRNFLTGNYLHLHATEPLKFKLQYRLPGTDIISSEKVLTININE